MATPLTAHTVHEDATGSPHEHLPRTFVWATVIPCFADFGLVTRHLRANCHSLQVPLSPVTLHASQQFRLPQYYAVLLSLMPESLLTHAASCSKEFKMLSPQTGLVQAPFNPATLEETPSDFAWFTVQRAMISKDVADLATQSSTVMWPETRVD